MRRIITYRGVHARGVLDLLGLSALITACKNSYSYWRELICNTCYVEIVVSWRCYGFAQIREETSGSRQCVTWMNRMCRYLRLWQQQLHPLSSSVELFRAVHDKEYIYIHINIVDCFGDAFARICVFLREHFFSPFLLPFDMIRWRYSARLCREDSETRKNIAALVSERILEGWEIRMCKRMWRRMGRVLRKNVSVFFACAWNENIFSKGRRTGESGSRCILGIAV